MNFILGITVDWAPNNPRRNQGKYRRPREKDPKSAGGVVPPKALFL